MQQRKSFFLLAAALLALAAGGVAGCGSSGEDDPSRPAPKATEFPPTNGQTLPAIAAGINEAKLVASPAGKVFELGKNRYSFGVFALDRRQVTDAEVALYFAPGKAGKAIGPFPAEIKSLETPPAYRAQTSVEGPLATTVAYVIPEINFPKSGEWRSIALFRTDRGLEGTQMPSIMVGGDDSIPDVGEKPPTISTPTADEVADVSEIDTRIPPDRMHEIDFADALGKQPIVLVFATPQFCESRVCGPVVDIAEQVRDEAGDDAAFIHMEVFEDNDPGKGPRQQLTDFGLETEPWLFVIDKNGVIQTRIEGAFGAEELRNAVSRVTSG